MPDGCFKLLIPIAVLVPLLVACGTRQSVQTKVTEHRPDPVTAYLIAPDDEVEVIVWKQPEVSGKVTVTEDGTITVPLAGRVQAAGLTTEQLENQLTKRLAGFIAEPNVTVRVSEARSQAVYVIGEVQKPGVFRLRPGEVLSQALAEAGGVSEFADLSKIRISRRKPTETEQITVHYDLVQSGEDISADIPLAAGDVIRVP